MKTKPYNFSVVAVLMILLSLACSCSTSRQSGEPEISPTWSGPENPDGPVHFERGPYLSVGLELVRWDPATGRLECSILVTNRASTTRCISEGKRIWIEAQASNNSENGQLGVSEGALRIDGSPTAPLMPGRWSKYQIDNPTTRLTTEKPYLIVEAYVQDEPRISNRCVRNYVKKVFDMRDQTPINPIPPRDTR